MIIFILHEDHVSKFEASNKVFNGRTKVSSSSPDVFNEGDFFWVDAEFLSQPSIVELNALVFEELVVIGFIEHLDAQHDKA